jgi:hypothetical protein
VTRIDLPAPIFFAWIVLTLVLMGQGMRLAADRQTEREPSRLTVLLADEVLELDADTREVLYDGERAGRLAIFQELPERRLMRWVEIEPGPGSPLLIPISGLGPGDYVVADAPARGGAAEQEMDRPETTLSVRARFRVLPD